MATPTTQVPSPTVQWEDGHKPKGAPPGDTHMAVLEGMRSARSFMTVYDNVLPEDMCTTMYHQAVTDGKPWG